MATLEIKVKHALNALFRKLSRVMLVMSFGGHLEDSAGRKTAIFFMNVKVFSTKTKGSAEGLIRQQLGTSL